MEREEEEVQSGYSGNRKVRAAVRSRSKTLTKKAEELWKTTGTGVACILKTPWGEFRRIESHEDAFDEILRQFQLKEMADAEKSNSVVGQVVVDNNDDPLVTSTDNDDHAEVATDTVSLKGKDKIMEEDNDYVGFGSSKKRKAKGNGIHIEEPN